MFIVASDPHASASFKGPSPQPLGAHMTVTEPVPVPQAPPRRRAEAADSEPDSSPRRQCQGH